MGGLCQLLLGIGRAIVPPAFRADWVREWQSELYYQPRDFRLVARCAGAVVHALWLRKEEWSVTVLLQDLRYAIRGLRARPGFTLVCLLILALGIGVNTAVFSVLNGVLLKPLPYSDPDRLVQIWETNPRLDWTNATVAPANLLDWRERNVSFTGIAYYIGSDGKGPQIDDPTLIIGGEPERLRGMRVSENFFDVLGVQPALGRLLRAPDGGPAAPRAVVLSDAFWRRRFGADPGVVGRRIEMNGVGVEVAGVLKPDFNVPGADVDYWEPLRIAEARLRQMRRPHWFRTVARLKPGVTIDQARADMVSVAAELERQYPETNTQMGVGLGPLHDWFVGDVRQAMVQVMAAVGLVLLITCTNVASLLLARATARRREIGIRVAIGAGRIRLVRQLLTESFVLAAAAAALGVAVAYGGLALLRRFVPPGVPRLDQVQIDLTVLAFVGLVACVAAVLFGLAPAWHGTRAGGSDALKAGTRVATGEGVALRRALIAAEVALSVVLLAGAGLLVRSLVRLQAVDPGIDPNGALTFRISLPDRYDDDGKVAGFFADALSRLRALPGVQAAGATARLALEGYAWTGDLFIETQPDVHGRELRHKSVTSGYFAAAGLPLIRGRDFNAGDSAGGLPVVIVNRTLARRYYGDRDPIGTRIAFSRPAPGTTWFTIVGVAADEKQDALDAEVEPEVYSPHGQDARDRMSVVVRTAVDPGGLLPAVKREIAAVDPSIAVYDVRTMTEIVERSLAEERFSTTLLTGFALTALALAAIGLYGVVALGVTERTREIGVRIALGASRADVLALIVSGGVRVVLAGVAIGLVAALLAARAVEGFLFETAPADPLVLASVAMLLVVAGAIASYLPARRATRVDPAVALRAE